jgi:uncharacterized protein YqeY
MLTNADAKQRVESIEAYDKAGRQELAAAEQVYSLYLLY